MFQQPTRSITNMSTPTPQQWFLVYHLCWSSTPIGHQHRPRYPKIRTVSALTPGIKPRYLGGCDCDAQQMGYAKTHPSRSPKNIVGWRGRVVTVVIHFFRKYVCTPWKINRWNPKNGGLEDHLCFSIGWFWGSMSIFQGCKPNKNIWRIPIKIQVHTLSRIDRLNPFQKEERGLDRVINALYFGHIWREHIRWMVHPETQLVTSGGFFRQILVRIRILNFSPNQLFLFVVSFLKDTQCVLASTFLTTQRKEETLSRSYKK